MIGTLQPASSSPLLDHRTAAAAAYGTFTVPAHNFAARFGQAPASAAESSHVPPCPCSSWTAPLIGALPPTVTWRRLCGRRWSWPEAGSEIVRLDGERTGSGGGCARDQESGCGRGAATWPIIGDFTTTATCC